MEIEHRLTAIVSISFLSHVAKRMALPCVSFFLYGLVYVIMGLLFLWFKG